MPPQSTTPPSPALSLPPSPTPPSPALSLPPPPTPPLPTALQLPQNWTFPPPPTPLGPSPPSPLSSGFDISRHGCADTTMYAEQSLDERPMSQTILEDAGEVTYDVIKEGTIRKKPKLVTSDGHSYVIKVPGKKTTYWRCCVRRKGNHCGATVPQKDNVFIPGPAPHIHPGDPLVAKKTILARDAVQKHVGEFGLARTYRERQSVHSLIRKLLALPFLPAADIKRAFRKLQKQAEDSSEQVQDLFTYVSDEWLESSKWSEDEWSVYRQTIRTNNDTEGWHRKLNTKAGRGKVKTYRLLEILLIESKLVNLEVTRLLEGSTSRRCRLSDEWLFDLWDQYDNHDIVCEEFLGHVGTYYGQF